MFGVECQLKGQLLTLGGGAGEGLVDDSSWHRAVTQQVCSSVPPGGTYFFIQAESTNRRGAVTGNGPAFRYGSPATMQENEPYFLRSLGTNSSLNSVTVL